MGLDRIRFALVATALTAAIVVNKPLRAEVIQDDRGVASVTETVRGTPVKVSYLASSVDPAITVIIGTFDRPQGSLSLDEASSVVDLALGQLDQHRRLPERIEFQPASLREPLLALLRLRLTRPGANWNPKTGTARAGNVYRTLAGDMLAITETSPLAAAFAHHGYRLASNGRVYHVEVGKVPGRGAAKLPTEIQEMGLVATRER